MPYHLRKQCSSFHRPNHLTTRLLQARAAQALPRHWVAAGVVSSDSPTIDAGKPCHVILVAHESVVEVMHRMRYPVRLELIRP